MIEAVAEVCELKSKKGGVAGAGFSRDMTLVVCVQKACWLNNPEFDTDS